MFASEVVTGGTIMRVCCWQGKRGRSDNQNENGILDGAGDDSYCRFLLHASMTFSHLLSLVRDDCIPKLCTCLLVCCPRLFRSVLLACFRHISVILFFLRVSMRSLTQSHPNVRTVYCPCNPFTDFWIKTLRYPRGQHVAGKEHVPSS